MYIDRIISFIFYRIPVFNIRPPTSAHFGSLFARGTAFTLAVEFNGQSRFNDSDVVIDSLHDEYCN